jgi:hypothetical protein
MYNSFELLFFWHKRAWWWRLECTASFCSCGWIETVVLKKQHCECRVDCKKCDRKKQQKGGLCGSLQKDCASHEVRMVRIFAGWGLCPAELPVIIYQVKPDRFLPNSIPS